MIEPINSHDIRGYFLDDFGYAETLIAAAGIPNLKLQFDIYHRQIMHGDVTMALERLLPMIGHVQVASVPHRAEPAEGNSMTPTYSAYLIDWVITAISAPNTSRREKL